MYNPGGKHDPYIHSFRLNIKQKIMYKFLSSYLIQLLPLINGKREEASYRASAAYLTAKNWKHHGIYLSSNSVSVDFSTKQRFHCPASLKK